MKKIILLFTLLFTISNQGYSANEEIIPFKTINKVLQAHQKASLDALRILMHKLYLRNPKELKKGQHSLKQAQVLALQTLNRQTQVEDLNNTRGRDSVKLAFEKTYTGDRILALIYGLTSMLMDAYKNKQLVDEDGLKTQDFYELARNLEIINWQLNNSKKSNGKLYLLSNSFKKEKGRNLSFEQLFGKLISQQDMLVEILRLYRK